MKADWVRRVALVACGCAVWTATGVEIDLAGEWILKEEESAAPAVAMAVPGDVQSALLAAKRIPDPYFGRNEKRVQWPGQTTWLVSRTFAVDSATLAKKRIVLRLEDVDTFATVSVNGKPVGETDNRFRRWEFDVKPFLKEGENVICGRFRSIEKECRSREFLQPRDIGGVGNGTTVKINLVRKPQCHGGWDWGLSLLSTGFCGPVKILASDEGTVDYVTCEQTFAPGFAACDVTMTVHGTRADGRKETFSKVFHVEKPKLWWPNGMGEQAFHEFTMEVYGEKVTRRLGLRTVEVVNERTKGPKGEDELSMAFKVNGVSVFCKGADWIPCDALANRQTRERYRDLIGSMRTANMNMVRVWGGGQYERDDFYEACDEMGILVWQDFMFACAVYPDDADFLRQVRLEAEHQVLRLRDHASIALWCGDNECLGAVKWNSRTPEDLARNKKAWEAKTRVLEAAVKACDPARVFWPSSPCCGPGDFGDGWKTDSKGDMHYWEVWHANRDFEAYYAVRPRFCSEFGFQSYSSSEVAALYCMPDRIRLDHPDFEHHQKDRGGNARIRRTMGRYFREPQGDTNTLYLSQVQQAFAIKTAVESWRHQRPRCMGTLFWQLNDVWPVASWSSVEYGGKWKQLQHHARRFYAPVAAVGAPAGKDGKDTEVWAINDRNEPVKATVTVSRIGFDGTVRESRTLERELPPQASVSLATVPQPADAAEAFLYLELTADGGATVHRNERMLAYFKDSPVAKAKVTCTPARRADGAWTVTLATDKPAFYVWANAYGIRGEFDDNSFTLLPGKPRTLVFASKDPAKTYADFAAAVRVKHLAETYE